MIPIKDVIQNGKQSTARQKRIWEMYNKHMANLDPYENYRSMRNDIYPTRIDGKTYLSKIYGHLGYQSEFIKEHTRQIAGITVCFSDWIKEPYKIIVRQVYGNSFRYLNTYDKIIVHLGRETIKAIRDREFVIKDFVIVKDQGKYKYITLRINHRRKNDQIIIEENKLYSVKRNRRTYLGINIDQVEVNVIRKLHSSVFSVGAKI